ncbi:peptidase domain-containing ABC transporter [Prochlorococcus marinus]|uniref:peptidase domain-containing ABC transporter n=1 Tax=Prochlorococcus marinus TaxID=1219 RepID=UPI001ADBAB54|nr:peptidase domain-containing ABC transporter [Prochlorococcus marinus]MBO8218857.1 peptidase domain-containing ABC transporter [Prochlorococcus marinus CUG1416]MBW3051261.1 type I secretion system permease/ATPase [Prochlorococcus marinus str. MU1416]
MVKFNQNIERSELKKIFNFSEREEGVFDEHISYVTLEAGQKLNKFGEDIPGVFLIEEGEMRLLGMDINKEIFTIEKFSKKQLVGAQQILSGTNKVSLAAASNVKGILIPTDIFLDFQKNKTIKEYFRQLTLNELFLAISENEKLLDTYEIFGICKKFLKENIKVNQFDIGENFLDDSSEFWLVSSSNIDNFPIGSLIKSPLKIKINGEMPGRLIPLNKCDWLIKSKDEKPKEKIYIDDDDIYSNFKSSKFKKKRDAFEDRFGRLNKNISYPHSSGEGSLEETLACLRMLSHNFDLPFRKDLLKRIIGEQLLSSRNDKLSIFQLAAICELLGLKSSILKPDSPKLLERIPLPSLTFVKDHPVIIWEQKEKRILLSDPLRGQNWIKVEEIFNEEFCKNIQILFVEHTVNSPRARFGLKWFFPALKKHRNSLIQVVIASFFVQLLGLFNPLLIQQIIDAVISQGNLRSLNVLGSLLIAMAIAQAIIGSLRTYLFTDTTNRMDISLGASIIHHLFRLPINYFSTRPVGEVSSRINELEKIRNFLTGTSLTVILDSIFSFIYICVMLTYSVKLTFFALAVVPFFIILTLTLSPVIRKQLRDKAASNARVSSHLVETLTGMETVKGQGMESQSEWQWEKFYGRQIQAGFKNTITSTAAGSASNFLQQLSGLIVIWTGALIVLDGKMSLGQLIAFRILSGYVTNPLLRLATLWQNFQETIISLERLSDIVDQKEEIEISGINQPPLAPIKGRVKYEKVNFSFNNKVPLQLLNINFEIIEGSVIGIVGTSGSGKSTLLKLLTRFYNPNEGCIYLDGQDISKIDLYSLRSQIGLVPQDCFLFDGSIQDNIALTKPEASAEEIKNAAKIACAHDFIEEMSAGYASSVGERGSNLSGGQRQRIAIARMTLMQPNMLILDEATSALDIDTEIKVIQNLVNNFKGKTIFFISHRLNRLTFCNQILVLNKGVLEEKGTHQELMILNGRYATLYRQQGSEIK